MIRVNKKLFHWEPEFTRMVVRLAIPIAIQSLVAALMHIVDNVMIGQLGELEMASVTQANRVTFLFQLTMFGVVGGASVFSAQFWGKKDIAGIRRVLGLALMAAGSIALLFALPGIFMPEQVMGLLLKDKTAAQMGARYLRIVAIGYLFQAVSQVYAAVQKSTEQVRLPMAASIVAIVTNTLLNVVLIFGKLGFPKLGVEGAALATIIGSALELIMVVVGGYLRKMATAARPSELRVPSQEFVRRYFKVALPVMLNEGFWALGILMYSVVYGHMGNDTVAAVSIYNNVEQLAAVVLRGMTHACAVIVGMSIGAEREDEAQLHAGRMLLGSMAFAQITGLIVILCSSPIVAMFNVMPSTAASARQLIQLYGCFIWLGAANTVLIVGIMRAGGDVKFSMWLDAGLVWALGVPLVALGGLVFQWPITYVYLLTQVENLAKVVIGLWRLRSRRWINNLVQAPTE